jgi:CRISPR-associated exonuclease Cas4
MSDSLLPISALQHWCYCPRQWGLIHLEQGFEENVHTLRGQAVHQRVDIPGFETRPNVRVERALPLWSDRLGLIGKADLVEFAASGVPYPVEYKQGSRHKSARVAACDDLQLAAQALCLEEMAGLTVPEGAIYYASPRRRRIVTIDAPLRTRVAEAAAAIRALATTSTLPAPIHDQRCRACSLVDLCQPTALADKLRWQTARDALFEPDET